MMAPSSLLDFLRMLLYKLSGGFGLIGLLLTVFCLIHAIRTRQNFWWYMALFLLPPFGALIYLFAVIMKGQSSSVSFQRPNSNDMGAMRRRIQELEASLAETDTIAVRSELGQAWLKLENFEQAKQYFESCLQGNFKNDPFILYGLAQACYGKGKFQDALTTLEKTFREDYRDYLDYRRFLQAKILAELERTQEALDIYANLGNTFLTPEFFCRQALLYNKLGEVDKANAFFLTATRQGEKLSPDELNAAQEWLKIAEMHLAANKK